MGVVGKIPRLDFKTGLLHLPGFRRNSLHVSHGGRTVSIDEVVEQAIDITGRTGHTTFQCIVGIRRISQQLCQFSPQVDKTAHNFKVVERIVVRTLRVVGHIEALPQFPAVGIHHKGNITRRIKRDDPPVKPFLPGCLCSLLTLRFGQTGQLCFVGQVKIEVLVLLQVVLRKLQRKPRQLSGEGPQPGFSGLVEQGTCAAEAFISLLQQHPLFGR